MRLALQAMVWLTLVSAIQACAATPSLKSGQFEGLMLAVDSAGHLTGYFREDQGDPPKRCRFYLTGTSQGGRATINSWSIESFAGQLATAPGGVRLTIARGHEHAGCGLVLPPEISTGLLLEQVRLKKWIELRSVQSSRAYFHRTADAQTRLPSYVVAGDVVAVLTAKPLWIEVEYQMDDNRWVRRWLRRSDTLGFEPR